MSVQIRPAADRDLEALVRLSLRAWAPVFASFRQVLGPEIYSLLYPDWQARQRADVEQTCGPGTLATVLVAEVDGAIAGFIAYSTKGEERTGEVELLAVHPADQHRGLSTALNQAALARMQADGVVLVGVSTGGDPGHAPARRAYEKAGYRPLPQVRYYRNL